MSVYGVHAVCWRARKDEAFRAELERDPNGTLGRFPLSDAERLALLGGDVATLEGLGAHGYLLANLGRFSLFGLDRESYIRRIKRR